MKKSGPPYVDPRRVDSPRARWKLERVLHDGGKDSWSAAEGAWDGRVCLALRWNGGDEGKLGTPQSRGLPTWFIVPSVIEPEVRNAILRVQLRARIPPGSLTEELVAIGQRCASLPDLDKRTPDQILGYDESGLPR